MQEVLEALAIGLTMVWMLIVILGFIAFVRYLRYKEKKAIVENGRLHEKERSHE